VSDGSAVRVRQGELQANLEASVDARVPVGGAWLRSATCATHALGNAIGPMAVEPANVEVA
jgi:hypothetical protein